MEDVLSNNASTAPEWMIYAAFVLGVVNALVVLIPLLMYLFKDGELELRLTRDTFFRITEVGETLFANAVFVANGAPINVFEVTMQLVKTDSPTKTYDVNVLSYGTKKMSFTSSAEHHFYSKSPHTPLIAEEVFRPLWHGVLTNYNEKIEELCRDFENELLDIALGTDFAKAAEDDEARAKLVSQGQALVDRYAYEIDGLVQLEPGTYSLTATVKYRVRGGPLRGKNEKCAVSSIGFDVDEKVRAQYKNKIKKWLEDRAAHALVDRDHTIRFPEYSPLRLVEL